jgi:hypothetical protein
MALLDLEKLRKDINILFGYIRCLMAKSDENCPLVATEWSNNHSVTLGNAYTAGTYVFYNNHVYKCLFDNEGILPTNTTYWLDLGEGHLLAEEQSDWNATGGRRFILNKPTNTSDFNNNGQDGSSPYATINDLNTSQDLDAVLNSGNVSTLDAYINSIYLFNPHTPSGGGYVSIAGDKNRFNFYDNTGQDIATLQENRLILREGLFNFSISKPTIITDNRVATFQDASGTVAYLSDIKTYGLYSQTAESLYITSALVQGSIIGVGQGSLSVPANIFKVADSFHLRTSGKITSANNEQLRISLKSGSNIIATTGTITLPSTTNKNWELTAEFTIRKIGIAGVAELQTNGKFLYNKDSNNALEGINFDFTDTVNFNTTVLNTLDIVAIWESSNIANTIHSNQLTLTKTY